jgi:hypothetical protein
MKSRGHTLRRIAPIVFREVSLLVLWLLSAPFIDNYIAVEALFEPIWYTSIGLGHLFRLFVLFRLFKTPSFLRWAYRAAGIPMAILWGLILFGEIRVINPYYLFLLVPLGLLVGYLHWSRRLHGWVANAAFFLLIPLTIYYRLFTLMGIYLSLYALLTLGGVIFGRNIYRPPAWVASMAFMNLFVVFFLFYFRFVNGEHLDRVSKHPAVERLFVYDNSDPVGRMIGKNIMIIQEVCDPDKYLIGSHDGGAGLALVDRKNNLAYANPYINECSNDILVDCVNHEATAGDFGNPGNIFFFDLNNWPNQSKPAIPIPGKVVYSIFDNVNI